MFTISLVFLLITLTESLTNNRLHFLVISTEMERCQIFRLMLTISGLFLRINVWQFTCSTQNQIRTVMQYCILSVPCGLLLKQNPCLSVRCGSRTFSVGGMNVMFIHIINVKSLKASKYMFCFLLTIDCLCNMSYGATVGASPANSN